MITPNEAFKEYLAAYRGASVAQQKSIYKPIIVSKEMHCCGMAILTNVYLAPTSTSVEKGAICNEISKEILELKRQIGIYPYRNLFYFAGVAYGHIFSFLEEIGFEKVNTFKNFAHAGEPLLMYGLLNK